MGKKKAFDHLGNEYESVEAMCQHYHITRKAYYYRLRAGYTLEQTLTGAGIQECTDHLGNTYDSLDDMCQHYHVTKNAYFYRLKAGYTLEQALTGAGIQHGGPRGGPTKKCTDHLGNTYDSIEDMRQHYHVKIKAYYYRLRAGYTLEQALTGDGMKYGKKACTDHLGNTYDSIEDMCQHYHITGQTYNGRLKAGYTLEKALTGAGIQHGGQCGGNKKCTDHLGNTYNSVKEMCQHYNVKAETYKRRLRAGYTQEQALTGEEVQYGRPHRETKKCTDYLGNTYNSVIEMCQHYNVKVDTYKYRLRAGYTQEQALTGDGIRRGKQTHVTDHLGNTYDSLDKMCQHYNIKAEIYCSRISVGYTQEQALMGEGIQHSSGRKRPRTDHKGIMYESTKEMCSAYGIKPVILYDRLKHGYTLEQSLTGVGVQSGSGVRENSKKPVTDFEGKEFPSYVEMCEFYNISYSTYKARRQLGWSQKECLLGKKKKNGQQIKWVLNLDTGYWECGFCHFINKAIPVQRYENGEIIPQYEAPKGIPGTKYCGECGHRMRWIGKQSRPN